MLKILYEDEHCVVVQKPYFMGVHRSELIRDKVTCLSALRNQLNQHVYPVHRLDRQTTGALMFAKDKESLSQLMTLFSEQKVRKLYIAVVRGWLKEAIWVNNPMIAPDSGNEVEASSFCYPLAEIEKDWPVGKFKNARYGLVAVQPHSGRWHQVRRHLRDINRPILGDSVHGDTKQNRIFKEQTGSYGMMLHAAKIQLKLPWNSQLLDVTAPYEKRFYRLLSQWNWPLEVSFRDEPLNQTNPSSTTRS
jgi:tRNA pseudouridine65 synthase